MSAKLGMSCAKLLAWDEVRAAVAMGPVSLLQYAPIHARIEHGQARGHDQMVARVVRKGVRYPASITPYGIFTEEGAGGLGIPSVAVERVGAVARGLLAALLRRGPDGEAVRALWETQVAHPPDSEGLEERSAFAWAEWFLAGYGLYLRDAQEKTFGRFLDILAEADRGSRQSLLGPSNPTARARAARWRTSGPLAGLLRARWESAAQEQRETGDHWRETATEIRALGGGGASVSATRLVAAAEEARIQRRRDWVVHRGMAGLPVGPEEPPEG